ncbi:unnamed protein product [Heligmosomoides polygyrus]|uniref:Methyltransf_21 domain-containing protein n=1 Tax=Heligmosomoides polygyrus TaxID=6339 RepID=A0A183G896_HELPZ|nr:unnamed protein product [Heligmosomoides polygyrus]
MQLWGNLWKGVKLCEKLPFMVDLKIEDFHNSDETKRHIPSRQTEPSVIVTLGIGQDTRAEEALRKVLPAGSLFYGADPIQDVNEQLYSKFGTYFPFAVGAYSKISKASVLINSEPIFLQDFRQRNNTYYLASYVDRTVVHIDLVYFLNDIIGRKVYDDLWIDAEGAEYDMFPYFYKGGKLDQYDITLCQFNLEVHDPDDEKKEMFRKFIFEILKDGRYAFFRPVQGRHIRLYFLNFVNPHCVSKYIFRSPIVDQFGKF